MADVELVVAVSENDVIGRANQLPWRLSGDLRHFRALTMGHYIFMGRKTYESIGKALPGRTNWILSRSAAFAPSDAKVVRSLEEAQSAVGESPLMVIGGAEIYPPEPARGGAFISPWCMRRSRTATLSSPSGGGPNGAK